jgi:hypothetical protein
MESVRRREEGQNLVILGLALPVLLALLALALDGGYAYAQRQRMQIAADAAALAGARALALDPFGTSVSDAVGTYATANGASSYDWEPVGEGAVWVEARVTWNTFVAAVVGQPTMTASAVAVASLDYLSGAGDLLPIGIHELDFIYGQTYTLWDDDHEAPGAFGWLDWDGPPLSVQELADNILHPENSGYWQIGDLIPAKTGVAVGAPVRNALDTWIGRNVTVPTYDQVTGCGANTRFRVSGFAEFVLTGYNFHGGNKQIFGHFVRWVEPGPGGGTHGVRVIRITN